jgi:hypothetical protein
LAIVKIWKKDYVYKKLLQEGGNNWGNNFSPIPEDWNINVFFI